MRWKPLVVTALIALIAVGAVRTQAQTSFKQLQDQL
jgi:hypothetical protein